MENDEMNRIVLKVARDAKTLSDFLAKLCAMLALDNGCTNGKIEVETSPTKDNKIFVGKLSFKLKE